MVLEDLNAITLVLELLTCACLTLASRAIQELVDCCSSLSCSFVVIKSYFVTLSMSEPWSAQSWAANSGWQQSGWEDTTNQWYEADHRYGYDSRQCQSTQRLARVKVIQSCLHISSQARTTWMRPWFTEAPVSATLNHGHGPEPKAKEVTWPGACQAATVASTWQRYTGIKLFKKMRRRLHQKRSPEVRLLPQLPQLCELLYDLSSDTLKEF